MFFNRCEYDKLNGKQKENYNFQVVSSLLGQCGFLTIRLSDDWNSADFLAKPFDSDEDHEGAAEITLFE